MGKSKIEELKEEEWLREIEEYIDLDDDEFEANFDEEISNVSVLETARKHKITADAGQDLMRVDRFLQEKIPNISRSKVQEAIMQERVFVNARPVKSSYKVKPHDVISMEMPESPMRIGVIPEDIPLNIVYEDDQLLVVNKPAGLVVHPGFNNWTGTLVNGLTYYFDNLPTQRNGEDKPGLVHRIDKDTSGLLVVAKTELAMTKIAKQFFDHSSERTYYALVWGHVQDDEGTINGNIGRHPKDRRMRTVYTEKGHGKWAVTHYKVLKRLRYVTLIQCNLETGRTHQIRVHMKHIGHTLVQDKMYGGQKIMRGENTPKYRTFIQKTIEAMDRQALHAKSLGFKHPTTNEWMQFDSELPEDFQECLKLWEEFVGEEDKKLI